MCEKWCRKQLFCGGMILWWGFKGIPPAQMNSMVPRTHMGRLLCPQPPLKTIPTQFPQFRKFPKQCLHCRGSGGFVRGPVESSHSRFARARFQKHRKTEGFQHQRLKTLVKKHKVFTTSARCAAQQLMKPACFSMFLVPRASPPGSRSQDPRARIPEPGADSQEPTARIPQP